MGGTAGRAAVYEFKGVTTVKPIPTVSNTWDFPGAESAPNGWTGKILDVMPPDKPTKIRRIASLSTFERRADVERLGRLIAAAPQLLAALETAIASLDIDGPASAAASLNTSRSILGNMGRQSIFASPKGTEQAPVRDACVCGHDQAEHTEFHSECIPDIGECSAGCIEFQKAEK